MSTETISETMEIIKAFSPEDQEQYEMLITALRDVSGAEKEAVLNGQVQAYINSIRAQYLTNSSSLDTENKNQVIDALAKLNDLQLAAYKRVNTPGGQVA